jgi:hypothetical protein
MPGRQSARHDSRLATSLARWTGLTLAIAAVVASVAAAGFYLSRTARGPVQTEGAAFAPASCPPGEQPKAGSCAPKSVDRKVAQTGLGTGIGAAPRSRASAARHRGRHPHNAVMAGGCGLSHQCPGELSLGLRETNAGVIWTAAGENIGEGGPVPDTTAGIAQMAVRITQSMLNERPPDDGHRQNILSRAFRFIGITVTRDSHGTVWMTQDFSN